MFFLPANVYVDNRFVFTAGLQDMAGTNGYASWTSLPHFLYANHSLAEQYNMAPRKDKHGSFVSSQFLNTLLIAEEWQLMMCTVDR